MFSPCEAINEKLKKDSYFNNAFVKSITRDEAHKILLELPVGTYLIRNSNSYEDQYVLSVLDVNDLLKNFTFAPSIDSRNEIAFKIGNMEFDSMQRFIEYYRVNPLSGSLKLASPYIDVKRRSDISFDENENKELTQIMAKLTPNIQLPKKAVALIHYHPLWNDDTLLRFKKNDKIIILKASDDNYWEGANEQTGLSGLIAPIHIKWDE
ncbi:hypothetical protein SNEBB_007335 [Seison nebaliae]|nr:hypothetical protein SNEBB_007335 [Seison nebaliae]